MMTSGAVSAVALTARDRQGTVLRRPMASAGFCSPSPAGINHRTRSPAELDWPHGAMCSPVAEDRWGTFRHYAPDKTLKVVRDEVFPHFKTIGVNGNGGKSTFSEYMADAQCLVPKPSLLASAVSMIHDLPIEDTDTPRATCTSTCWASSPPPEVGPSCSPITKRHRARRWISRCPGQHEHQSRVRFF